jgi:hypothetical protein
MFAALSHSCLDIVKSLGCLKEATDVGPSMASDEKRVRGGPGMTSYHEGTFSTIFP